MDGWGGTIVVMVQMREAASGMGIGITLAGIKSGSRCAKRLGKNGTEICPIIDGVGD